MKIHQGNHISLTLAFIVLAFNLSFIQSVQADVVRPTGVWQNTSSMHTTRIGHMSTLLPNGKVLVAGGHDDYNNALISAELFDPFTGTWALTDSMITTDGDTATLLPNGKVLVTGGSSAELYDPVTGTWAVTDSMHNAYWGYTTTLLPNGKVLITAGSNAELYDPANETWTATTSMRTPRNFHAATLLPNGKVLVAGGWNDTSGALSSAELYDPANETWTVTGSMSTARTERMILLPNGLVLIAGGYDGNLGAFTSAELYNPQTGTWRATGSMISGHIGATATLLPDGVVLVTGGNNGDDAVLADAELYNPASETWTVTCSLNLGRLLHTATLLPNGLVLVAGGVSDAGNSAELYNYAPVGTWQNTSSMHTTRIGHMSTLLPNGKVLVAGGHDDYNNALISAELFDPFTGTWALTDSMITTDGDTATLLPNGKVLVTGGSSAELYDPVTGTWAVTDSMHNAYWGYTTTLLPNGKVLITAGSNAELYDPANETWTATTSMRTPRNFHAATLLPNGKVLVAGGWNDTSGALSSAELYDPANETWTVTGSMSTARTERMILLPNGLVLIAGGYDGNLGAFTSAELYNPQTGTWRATGSMISGHIGATATLLPDGVVLVTGGNNGDDAVLADAELYNPASETWTVTCSLNLGRLLHTATLLPNGLVLVAGGVSDAGNSAELYNYAPVGTWQNTSSMHTTRIGHMSTLLPNGKVLVAGGHDDYNNALISAELFDPFTGTWALTDSMITTDGDTATLLPNGKVLVTGGSSAELYDPVTGTWAVTDSMHNAYWGYTTTLLPNGKVLITAGSNAELYDPANETWTATTSMRTPRNFHAATLLPNGKVLVAGGWNDTSGALSSAELYDPANETWTVTGSMSTARTERMILLPNGLVLIAGGYDGNLGAFTSAELYNPQTGTWRATGSMISGHIGATATLLPDGVVLVTGGNNGDDAVLADAELYNPASETWTVTCSLNLGRLLHTATLLPNGLVLVAGGVSDAGNSAELYDASVPPVIIGPNDVTVTYGSDATFSVEVAVDSPFVHYQWRKHAGGTTQNVGTDLPSYTAVKPSVGDSGAKFDVVVTRGTASATSREATLTVSKAALSITASGQSKTYGQTLTFGSGSTLFTSSGLQNGETIGTVTLACTGGAATAAVGSYPITPSAATGGTFSPANYNITYNAGSLTVTAPPLPVINTQPENQMVIAEQDASFTVMAEGIGLTYQWKHGTANVGVNSPVLNLMGVTTADAGSYSVVVANLGGSISSGTVTLTVSLPPYSWRVQYFGANFPSNPDADPTADPDGDGFTNLQEYQMGTDPTDYYNHVLPTLTVTGGDSQSGVMNAFLSLPLTLRVTQSGSPLVNAPVTFAASSPTLLSPVNNGTKTASLAVRTDTSGYASAWLFLPTGCPENNTVTVTAQSGAGPVQVMFSAAVTHVVTPVITPNGGTFTTRQNVSISCVTVGAVIRYTLNGTDPTAMDTAYSGPILVEPICNLRARAFLDNVMLPSAVQSADFFITGAIAAGDNHTIVLKYDGSVWAAGENASGQLGNGGTADHTTLAGVNTLGVNSGTIMVQGGGSHSLALKSDGSVMAWGENSSGQLGNNSTINQRVPVAVHVVTSGVTAIAGGGSHSLALMSGGSVKAWGENSDGQVGDGSIIDRKEPVAVTGVSGVIKIAAGGKHSLALLSSGAVQAWGDNSNGQLGDNSTTDRHTAVSVYGLTSVADIEGGGLHSLALLSDGTVRAWGDNLNGQLGDGTTTDQFTPVAVTIAAGMNLIGVKAIAAGTNHSLALLNDGTVYAWGDNTLGQLGDGTTTDRSRAVPVSGLTDVIAIAAGSQHSLALKSDGSVWIWGYTNYGLALTASYSTVPVRREDTVWLTAAPVTDTDRDGLPDTWEVAYWGSITAHGANDDPDGDGLTNLQEYKLGLDPTVDQSAQSAGRLNYIYDRLDRLDDVTGNAEVDLTLDKEGNITNVTP